MHLRVVRRRFIPAVALAAVLAVPGAAAAAKPKAGSYGFTLTKRDAHSGESFATVAKGGKSFDAFFLGYIRKADDPRNGHKCTGTQESGPAKGKLKIKSGKFKYNGKIKWFDARKRKFVSTKLLVTGKFTSSTKFKGEYQINVAGCKTPKVKYTAKLR